MFSWEYHFICLGNYRKGSVQGKAPDQSHQNLRVLLLLNVQGRLGNELLGLINIKV